MNVASPIAITGMGVVCSIGHSVPDFLDSLRCGRCGVSRLPAAVASDSVQVGALVRDFSWERWLARMEDRSRTLARRVRKLTPSMTVSTRLSVCAAMEAYLDARLDAHTIDPTRLGVIVAGSNLSQDYIARNWARYQRTQQPEPRYALSFSDSHQVGCLSEIFVAHGPGLTVGAAAASGNSALFQAVNWIRGGLAQACLVVGASTEFAPLELEGFALLGAAACGKYERDPTEICRPFDRGHAGFVWGQGSACVVLEAPDTVRQAPVQGEILGASLLLHGNHLPEPSLEGEVRAMKQALQEAGLDKNEIGYINAHGSSAPLGDRTELAAIKTFFGSDFPTLPINATKGLTGHCFNASGVMELIACALQLRAGFIHPNRNLQEPIDSEANFAGPRAAPLDTAFGLSNGFGFGGFNSSIVLRKAAPCG